MMLWFQGWGASWVGTGCFTLYYDAVVSGVGGQLGAYRLSSAIPQDQQWGVVSVDDVSLVSSHITTGLSRSSMQVGSSFLHSLCVLHRPNISFLG